MAAWIVCALYAVVLLKPAEFLPALSGIPIVHLLFAAGVMAAGLEVSSGRLRWEASPSLTPVVAFFAAALAVTAFRKPEALSTQGGSALIVLALYCLASVGFASKGGLQVFTAAWIGCAVLVSAVAVSQGLAPLQCVMAAPEDWSAKGTLEPDGRLCQSVLDCREDGDPDRTYRCEHVGPLATTSIGGRVRYRGSLGDPNELSLMVGTAIPWVLTVGGGEAGGGTRSPRTRKGHRWWLWPLRAVGLALILSVILMSRSRGGAIVLFVTMGIELVRRWRVWGALGGGLLVVPVLLFGGRTGEDAEASSEDRADLLREAFQFLKRTHGLGMGIGQFADASSLGLTAHNSFLLAATEVGLPGLLFFGLALYTSMKVPYVLWLGDTGGPRRPELRRFAASMAISLTGAIPGISFLSWSYKDVLYLLCAGSAALYSTARRSEPDLRIRVTGSELSVVSLALLTLLALFWVAAKLHS